MADAARKHDDSKGAKGAPALAAAEPAKAKLDILGIGLVLLALVNLGALGGMGYFTQKLWQKVQELQLKTQMIAEKSDKEEVNPMGKELQPAPMGLLYPLDSFLVNISSDTGPKFLQTQMELELADPAAEDELARKKAAVRDAIIVLLSSRTYKELREPAGFKKLRGDILRSVNNLLTTGKLKEIYFTQFHFN